MWAENGVEPEPPHGVRRAVSPWWRSASHVPTTRLDGGGHVGGRHTADDLPDEVAARGRRRGTRGSRPSVTP